MSIEPTIFIAAASLVISLIIAVFNIWRANRADNREDSAQLTTVIVQLESIKEETDTKNALQIVYDSLNQDQQKKIVKNEEVKKIFDLYGVDY